MHDLIVIGGGPAGLTATMYAVQKGLDVLLVTRDLGGKTNYRLQLPFVERYMVINGDEVISRFVREIEYLGFAHVLDNVESIRPVEDGYEVTLTEGGPRQARCLIVATGAKAQLLNVPGEKEFMMRGLCYSAISYAQLFIDHTAVVIGDDDLALRGVAELARLARHVTLVAPTTGKTASPLGVYLSQLENVDFLVGYRVKAIKGDIYARGLVIEKGGEERELEADAIFVEMDLIPRSRVVEGLVELDEKGRIKINSRNETSAPGIFAAGDVTDGYAEQVLIAIGEGAKAALTAYEYLLKAGQPVVRAKAGQ
ncbi:MAG TPA: FAD-binding protein [Chloroflexi bacterium]|nr:FAD-binding protein [Chloroflexota bacterium]